MRVMTVGYDLGSDIRQQIFQLGRLETLHHSITVSFFLFFPHFFLWLGSETFLSLAEFRVVQLEPADEVSSEARQVLRLSHQSAHHDSDSESCRIRITLPQNLLRNCSRIPWKIRCQTINYSSSTVSRSGTPTSLMSCKNFTEINEACGQPAFSLFSQVGPSHLKLEKNSEGDQPLKRQNLQDLFDLGHETTHIY
ncbi:hypothetical protein NPIL_259221 [Nephila pilipes]|uniref:Uncharacterized protein n=1 Tax=Nephila pilipes TaxID=299642 RepID=A0A8X6MSJ0_NEPPI|nr:hypothetical protein NPIL_259221 [Nephila pilipes]